MPIRCPIHVAPIDQGAFRSLDYQVMGTAFAVHRDLGSLCPEQVYRNVLAERLARSGLDVQCEVPISVSFEGFEKRYYADLVVDGKAVYELKAAEGMTPWHRAQALNYILLLGLHHGKAINFRAKSVQGEYVSTKLTPRERYRVQSYRRDWRAVGDTCAWFGKMIDALLGEWGAFLDVQLFYDALDFLHRSEKPLERRVRLEKDGTEVGAQGMYLISKDVAIRLTALTRGTDGYEQSLRKLLSLTSLRAIQWVNFNHHVVGFNTIERQ